MGKVLIWGQPDLLAYYGDHATIEGCNFPTTGLGSGS
jgi:hypothetical protein